MPSSDGTPGAEMRSGADEVGTLKGLPECRAILDNGIGDYRGRFANTAGDSVLAEFGSAVDAVQCAVEAQATLAEADVFSECQRGDRIQMAFAAVHESVHGTKRTYQDVCYLVAFGGKADISQRLPNKCNL